MLPANGANLMRDVLTMGQAGRPVKAPPPAPPPVGTAEGRASVGAMSRCLPAPAGAATALAVAAGRAGRALFTRPRLVDGQGAALEHGAVEVFDGGIAA